MLLCLCNLKRRLQDKPDYIQEAGEMCWIFYLKGKTTQKLLTVTVDDKERLGNHCLVKRAIPFMEHQKVLLEQVEETSNRAGNFVSCVISCVYILFNNRKALKTE